METKRKVLSVNIRSEIISALKNAGYDTITADTGREAQLMAESHCPDLILTEYILPDISCQELLCSLRKWSDMPVIVTSEGGFLDAVDALDNGADDYICSPVEHAELLSRIKVAFRHAGFGCCNPTVAHIGTYSVGNLVIDFDKYRAYLSGNDTELTQNEFKIVALLGKNAGKVLTYEYIMTQLWGPHTNVDNQILRVNITNIRKKLKENSSRPRYIFTETGVGYRMAEK